MAAPPVEAVAQPVFVQTTITVTVAVARVQEAAAALDLPPIAVVPAAVNPPDLQLPAPVLEAIRPTINFAGSASDFDLGQNKQNTWVKDWLSGTRDTAAARKLNNWKVSLPSARPGARI